MKKELKDYLHLYLGCECKVEGCEETLILTGVSYDDTQRVHWGYFENTDLGYAPVTELKPILHPLSSMTEEEGYELEMLGHDLVVKKVSVQELHAERTKYLLSKHFDLFGLIESGLAINSSTIK